ncbi:MAG: hypothetical protein N3A65_05780 [candidate division WOR-3 bacterium]|nr:hypothetical protein [candidate division WOR-3 bacterium]
MNISQDILVWISSLLTLFIFSFIFRDNPFYRFAEHLFVGTSAGYFIALSYHNVVYPNLIVPLFKEGQFLYVIPLILGILYITRFIPQVSWLVRIPIAFLLGWGSGVAIPAALQADVIKQIQGTMLTRNLFSRWDNGLWAVLILIGVIATLIFFFFSRERKGIIKPIANLGIIFIMLGFGASFGYTVMARISLLIGRFQYLLGDWLGIIK